MFAAINVGWNGNYVAFRTNSHAASKQLLPAASYCLLLPSCKLPTSDPIPLLLTTAESGWL